MHVVIIGGGIIGLSTAYYLIKEGQQVTVIDKGDLTDNCSFGNLGYISPSHFMPLATPGIITQGIKWMFDSASPFYIKPRLNLELIQWGLAFYKSANNTLLEKNMPHMDALIQLSRGLIKEVNTTLGDNIELTENGCWMLYKSEKTGEHEKHLAELANKYGLVTEIHDKNSVQAIETKTEVNVAGGVLYKDDAYLEPTKFMHSMLNYLKSKGVKFVTKTEINSFEKSNGKITAVITSQGKIEADSFVIANGSRIPEVTKLLGERTLLQGGKGYSFVYDNLSQNLTLPSILVDDRVATSPYGDRLRIGGTMEISGHNDTKLPKRIQAIYNAFMKYYPNMPISAPSVEKTWFGYRPVTPDGVPYIGKSKSASNVYIAGGHAMLGVTAATGTGLLITEMITEKPTKIEVKAFDPNRFY